MTDLHENSLATWEARCKERLSEGENWDDMDCNEVLDLISELRSCRSKLDIAIEMIEELDKMSPRHLPQGGICPTCEVLSKLSEGDEK